MLLDDFEMDSSIAPPIRWKNFIEHHLYSGAGYTVEFAYNVSPGDTAKKDVIDE